MKKKINIVLLIAVLGLWGTVLYKYISPYFVNNTTVFENENDVSSITSTIKSKDTFELKPLSRDPFLGKTYSEKLPTPRISLKRTIVNQSVSKPVKVIPKQPFPAVHYYGYIKNETGGSELVLLKMNGQLLKLKNNETKEGLKVIKIFKDSIKVSYGGEVKVVKK